MVVVLEVRLEEEEEGRRGRRVLSGREKVRGRWKMMMVKRGWMGSESGSAQR